MTAAMIADPDDHGDQAVPAEVETQAVRRASVAELFAGSSRAVAELAGAPVDADGGRHRKPDLSTPAGRIRHGYLGRDARRAVADVFTTYDQIVDDNAVPTSLMCAVEAARQALLLASVEEPRPVEVGNDLTRDMWSVPCFTCGAEAGLACMGVATGTTIHDDRIWALQLAAYADEPALCALLDQARHLAAQVVPITPADIETVNTVRGVL